MKGMMESNHTFMVAIALVSNTTPDYFTVAREMSNLSLADTVRFKLDAMMREQQVKILCMEMYLAVYNVLVNKASST
jgi:hypothetical protein